MPLSFYDGYNLVSLTDRDLPSPNERYLLFKAGKPACFLNWANEPIYRLNDEEGALRLSRSVLTGYAEFFFHFVRGQLGRFIIIQNFDELPWLPDLSAARREEAEAAMRQGIAESADEIFREGGHLPLSYIGHMSDDFYLLRGIVAFKNALFQTDILIAPYKAARQTELGLQTYSTGQLELINEALLAEELPFAIDPPPGEFG